MVYVKNENLTKKHITVLINKCGYEDISAKYKEYAVVVETPENEIIGFPNLARARRVLSSNLKRIQEERVAVWNKLSHPDHSASQYCSETL